jgi:tetratricopeptide (TPR) repeat protein
MTTETATTDDRYEHALALFDSGDFRACRELALVGLAERPEDVNLLRLAGRSSAELNLDDATNYLEQAIHLEPDNVDAWRELAEAFLYQDRKSEATDAIRQAVELRPEDVAGLVDLGLSSYAAGQVDEALSHLKQAVERDPGSAVARRALIDVYRGAGQLEEALKATEHLLQLEPDDVLATLDAAELNLALDRPESAVAEFARLGAIDDDPEHEIYAYHGMIQGEIRRERWRRALDLAIEATRVDRYGRTTDLLAFVVTQVFGQADRPAPSRAEIDEALAASLAEHRRLHAESLVL